MRLLAEHDLTGAGGFPDMELLLDVQNLSVRYGRRRWDVFALRGANLQIARGQIVGVLGESGSGRARWLRRCWRCCRRTA